MKITALVALGAVQAAIPNTGNRKRLGAVGVEDEIRENGGKYGFSGDLMEASFMSHIPGIQGEQAKREDTWFYYESQVAGKWYRVIYTPHSLPYGGYANADAPITTEDGTTGYTLGPCNRALDALYEAEEAGEDTAALKETCEEKCVLFSEGTDYFDAKDCNDPKGSLQMGHPTNNEWIKALWEFESTINYYERRDNGEEIEENWFDAFEPPHVVGSKIYPELANGGEQEVDESLVVDADITAEEVANLTETMNIAGNVDLETICRRLRSAGANVLCGDEETTEETPAETTTEETPAETTTEDSSAEEEEEDEESGFLVNGASLVLLFVSMAIFK